jgi:hypothetical protein
MGKVSVNLHVIFLSHQRPEVQQSNCRGGLLMGCEKQQKLGYIMAKNNK